MSGQETHWQPRTAGYWLIWAGSLKAKEQLRVQTRQALADSQLVGEQEVGGGGRREKGRWEKGHGWAPSAWWEEEASSQSWPGSLASGSGQKQVMCISGLCLLSQRQHKKSQMNDFPVSLTICKPCHLWAHLKAKDFRLWNSCIFSCLQWYSKPWATWPIHIP